MTDQSIQDITRHVTNKLQQLSPDLTYHCIEHTLDVFDQAIRIAEEEHVTDPDQLKLLQIAALYHDTGFLQTYLKHEEKSVEIFRKDAANMDLNEAQIDAISRLIMVTQIPQKPSSLLEKIICDADLDYLGRDDFFEISDTLRKEFLAYNIVSDDDQWYALQLKFLQNHQYHTRSAQLLRESVKQDHFAALLEH